jgi:hypothetical protein
MISLKKKKLNKNKKMPCYQGTGLVCPVALLAGFPSKTLTTYLVFCVFISTGLKKGESRGQTMSR